MPRIRTWMLGASLCMAATFLISTVQAVGPSETLLPSTTRGFVAIPNIDTLREDWSKTQLGQLIQDPVMKPFVEDLRRQFDERWAGTREKLGITVDDLKGVPGGEVSVAIVQMENVPEAVAVLVDVTGHQPQAQALLKKIAGSVAKQGGKQSQVQVAGTPVVVFTLPPKQGQETEKPRQAMYFLKDNLLAASDRVELIQAILMRMGGKARDSLADAPAFQAVMKRVKADAGAAAPHVRWYIQPIGYIEAMRAAQPDAKRRKGRTLLDAFKSQGFTAIQGIGGTLEFSVAPYEILHRTAVYAPGPYQGAMKMLKFPNGADFAPQAWVPAQVANYCTFYVDVVNAFDNVGPLFDELYNEGKPGLWKDVLDGLEKDPNGPRVNLRKDLVSQLGNRVTMVTDYQVPITTTSERLLFALETKDEKAVAAALKKLFENDPEMRRRDDVKPYVIWESVPAEKAAVPAVTLEIPGVGGAEKPARGGAGREQAIMPNQAITVAHGQLFVASHYDFLAKVLKEPKPREPLTKAVEYQLVSKALAKLDFPQKAAQSFAKTDEQYRPPYELIRQGKMPQSETLLGRVLNTAFGAGKKGTLRKQEIEGSKMPDYDIVRRYLGPSGLQAESEPQGWFIKGFLLPKG